MPDQTPTPDPIPQNPAIPQPSPVPGSPRQTPKRRRPRFLKIIMLLFAGILILIAILPTLLSMGWARRIAESKANAQLRGRLEIGDWSLGWFTGARMGPVTLYDDAGKPVLQLASVDTHLSLSDVLRGKFDLGTVPVTGLRLYVTREPDGTLNVQKLLPSKKPIQQAPPPPHIVQPSQPSPPPTPAPATKLPNISVDLELSDCQAICTDAATGKSVTLALSGSVKIPDINQPITNALQLAIQSSANSSAANISLDGSIAAVHDNHIDTDQPDVDETLKLSGLDLSTLQPMLSKAFTTLAGHGDGQLAIRIKPQAAGSIEGNLVVSNIRASGAATKNDTFAADGFTMQSSTNLPTAEGFKEFAATSSLLKSDTSIVLQQGSSKSSVVLTAETPVSALRNLAKNQAPGGDGLLRAVAEIDVAHLANQLPHLFDLLPDVSLDGGRCESTVEVDMTPTDAKPSASLSIHDVTGKNTKTGKTISLQPMLIEASAQTSGGGGALPDVRNIKAKLSSAFATGSLDAPMLSRITGNFKSQLADAQRELGTIIDFGSASLSGTIDAAITSQAQSTSDDPTASRTAKITGNLTASDLRVDRPKSQSIAIPAVNYNLAAVLVHSESYAIEKITGFSIAGIVGSANHPAVTTDFSTDLAFGKNSSVVASNVNLSNSINVPELRRELGTAAADKIPADYTLKLVLGATAAMSNASINIDMPSFAITDNHGLISAEVTKGVRFATGGFRQQFAPSGTLSISADLARLQAMLASSAPSDAATLNSGHLDGTIALSGDQKHMQFDEDYNATGMVVKAGKRTTPLAPLELKSIAIFGPGDALRVSAFSAEGAGGEVHLKQPLVLTASAAGKMSIDAELVGSGDVGQAMEFINAFKPAASAAMYAGTYTLDQSVSTAAGVISAKGSVQSNFTIQDNGAAAFVEPNLSLVDDLIYDQPHDSATINNLSLDMHTTGALRLSARGAVAGLTTAHTMNGVSATLHYDAAGLWKLIYATLSAEQRKSYSDVKISGVVDREFIVAGSYPADQPFNVAVQSLTVQGGIAIPSFNGKGMTIADLDLPLSLHGGQFLIAEPKPAAMNGGTLSLNGITVDLADPHQRLSIPDGTAMLNNVSLNSVFVKNAAGWVNNPLFVGTDQAAGILSVTIDHCNRLPTDDLMKATTADNDGAFHMHMVLGRVQLGAPMLADVSKAIGPLIGGKFDVPSLQGEIPNYTLDIAKGIMTTDMTMNLTQKKHPLHLWGTVALESQKLNMKLDLPTALFGGDNGPLAKLAGESLTIPITGTTSRPQFDMKSLVGKNLKNPGNDLKNIFKGIGG